MSGFVMRRLIVLPSGCGLELHGAHDQPGRGGVLLGVAHVLNGSEDLLGLERLGRGALDDQLLAARHVAEVALGHGGQQATEARVEASVVGDIEDHGAIRSHRLRYRGFCILRGVDVGPAGVPASAKRSESARCIERTHTERQRRPPANTAVWA